MNNHSDERRPDLLRTTSDPLESVLSRSPELYGRFLDIRKQVLTRVVAHLNAVQADLVRLIPKALLNDFSPNEIFLLLVAVYLHGIVASSTVMEQAVGLNLRDREAALVGDIIGGHSVDTIPAGTAPRHVLHANIRPRFLAVLFQLADALAPPFTRAPDVVRSTAPRPSETADKWSLCVDNVEIDSKTWSIKVLATPKTREQGLAVSDRIETINAWLKSETGFLEGHGLHYKPIDLRVDSRWLPRVDEGEHGQRLVPETDGPVQQIPRNVAAVVCKYDQDPRGLYSVVVKPCLLEAGLSPLIVGKELTADSMFSRITHDVEASRLTVGLLTGAGDAEVNFRLGVAAALRRPILVFVAEGGTLPGDLCDYEQCVVANENDLRDKLRAMLGR